MFLKKVSLAMFFTFGLVWAMDIEEVNSASKESLMHIKGVGELKADVIIAQRPYKSFEELQGVKGVGPVLVENIKNDVYKKGADTPKE